jgi:hypothetical protein
MKGRWEFNICKCLVPIYVLPEMKLHVLALSKTIFVSQFPHSCICDLFIYSQDRSAYFVAANRQTGPGNI